MTPDHKLGAIDGLVCDLDGVLYRGSTAIDGAAQAIRELEAAGVRVIFATNNATRTIDANIEHLHSFGIEARPEQLVTSAVVTAEELALRGWSGRTVFAIGEEGLHVALEEQGLKILEGDAGRTADIVVVASDHALTYDSLRIATLAVRAGAPLIGTNGDPTFPAADGLWPGAGAILAAVETAAGVRAEVMGKPHPPMMNAAARRLEGCHRIAVVGDQPDTDLAGARLHGWTSILVLSGVTEAGLAREVHPPADHVLGSIADLPMLLGNER